MIAGQARRMRIVDITGDPRIEYDRMGASSAVLLSPLASHNDLFLSCLNPPRRTGDLSTVRSPRALELRRSVEVQ